MSDERTPEQIAAAIARIEQIKAARRERRLASYKFPTNQGRFLTRGPGQIAPLHKKEQG